MLSPNHQFSEFLSILSRTIVYSSKKLLSRDLFLIFCSFILLSRNELCVMRDFFCHPHQQENGVLHANWFCITDCPVFYQHFRVQENPGRDYRVSPLKKIDDIECDENDEKLVSTYPWNVSLFWSTIFSHIMNFRSFLLFQLNQFANKFLNFGYFIAENL